MFTYVLLVAVCGLMVQAYPNGPPVVSTTEGGDPLCTSMSPTGHGKKEQETEAPYVYVLSQNCYKEGVDVHIAIKSTSTDSTKKYFEGFFTQVQEATVKNASYGTFSSTDTGYVTAYDCFRQTGSAVGHKAKAHFDTRVFKWSPPAGVSNLTLHFRSTIVKSKEVYWENVMSAALTYNANCMTGNFTQKPYEQGKNPDDTSDSTAIVPGILVAMAMMVLGLIMQ